MGFNQRTFSIQNVYHCFILTEQNMQEALVLNNIFLEYANMATQVYLSTAYQRPMSALDTWTGPQRLQRALGAAQVGRHMLLCQR